MISVTADGTLPGLLPNIGEPAEILDGDGRILGYFAPISQKDASQYARAAAHFDPREMKRRKESDELGLSIDQVLDHVRQLDASQ